MADSSLLWHNFSLSCTGEGNGDPLQCSCLENPRDGRAWWAAIYGAAQSRTRLKGLSSSSSSQNTEYIFLYNPVTFFNGKITKYDTESSCLMSVMHQQACRAGLLFPNFVNGENKMVGNLIKLTFKNISSNISSNAKWSQFSLGRAFDGNWVEH